MPTYLITEPAKLDLRMIWRTIAKDNRTAANDVLKHLEIYFETLARSPKIGRIREEFTEKLYVFSGRKSKWRSSYLIFYRIVNEGIQIIRIIEAHRDVPLSFLSSSLKYLFLHQ